MSKLNSIETKFSNNSRLILEMKFVNIEGYKPKMVYELYFLKNKSEPSGKEYFNLEDYDLAINTYHKRLTSPDRDTPVNINSVTKVFTKEEK